MNIENKVRDNKTREKLETLDSQFGPNTAGLAQRMYASREESTPLYFLKKAYITKCSINQF